MLVLFSPSTLTLLRWRAGPSLSLLAVGGKGDGRSEG
jgi:hypothetical protein